MLKAKNIIYGFCKYTNPPKNKYLISLYRSEDLNIIAVFPTSQRRAGVAAPKHGCVIRDNQVISYVFDAGHPIGKKKDSDEVFAFPLQTTIPFDYCFKEGEQDDLLKIFESPKVVGILSDEEYIDLIYAFYTSPLTPQKYKPDYVYWKSMGVLFQLNIPALAGMYGAEVRYKAESLLKRDLYDCVGTDTHSTDFAEDFLERELKKQVVRGVRNLILKPDI